MFRCHCEFGTLDRPPVLSQRKERTRPSHHAPYLMPVD
ncbi:hypothetical protein BS78_01G283700 [Paspalum vaginatum]|nr:hypothetical protein BS78_01G283700 [Paspalum vaginatum]